MLPSDPLTRRSRLAAVRATGLLDGAESPVLDRLTRLATRLIGAPIALVSLIDDTGQHFPGMTGFAGFNGSTRGTPLSHSFCQQVVARSEPLIVTDATRDDRVRENPAIIDMGVIAYAGVPLTTSDGETLGALCAIDSSPHPWTSAQIDTLRDLAAAAISELELQSALRVIRERETRLQLLTEKLEEERRGAERANQAKSDFLARMSHELRTPLNAIIGFTRQVLKNRDGSLNARDRAFLDRVANSGEHLLALINDILDLSKIEAGRVDLDLAASDVGALVREVVALLEGQPRRSEVALVADVPARLEAIVTDAAKLKQVLINLAGNALKFTHVGSVTLIVEADAAHRPTGVAVRDTGIGIAPDRLDAVFDAFEQADRTTIREYGGTGLGLAISRSLCTLLGATLSVTSEVGRGTEFRIALPR